MAPRRKIPVRKHHGIRDPLKQKEKLEKSLKKVLNNPPNQDDQKPGAKFTKFQQLLQDTKDGKKIKRSQIGGEDLPRNKKNNKQRGESSKDSNEKIKNSNAIKQFPDESDEDYLRRVNRITRESIKEAEYEAKYGVKVVRDVKTGAITIKKQPKNEIDELLKQKARQKQTKAGKRNKTSVVAKPMDPKLAKQLIKQAIKEDDDEREKEKAEILEEYKRDTFKFGETVHAPPTISTLPRRAEKNETVPRPGKKKNLLLSSLLNESSSPESSKANSKATKTNRNESSVTKAQLKGKRKDLPKATRTMLENERDKLIQLYRQYNNSKKKARN